MSDRFIWGTKTFTASGTAFDGVYDTETTLFYPFGFAGELTDTERQDYTAEFNLRPDAKDEFMGSYVVPGTATVTPWKESSDV